MITPPPHDSIKGESHPPEPLSRLERVAALFVGTITAAVGGYAVFETSNQAGTVMLLIVAIVFLLIGIQGTPLIRFTSSSASVELEQRKRTEVRQAIEQASEEYGAEKAEGIFEGVSLVAPNLLPESFSRYEEYENKLARELSKMDYTVSRVDQVAGFRPDFAVQQNGITVYVEVRHYASRIYTDMVNQAIGMAVILSTPVLLVASSELTPHARKVLANTDKVQFVTWQDEKDNPQLREALNHLLGSVEDL